ncbi:MAG TPA: hypothetical protein VFC74_09180 [Oscillospiraceae bacterium]|nr:hypothetical protein [Oscillospiraceae bacterium]
MKTQRLPRQTIPIVALCLLLLTLPTLPSAAQSTVRYFAALATRWPYRAWQEQETDYFQLRFTESDQALAAWLGQQADQAVEQATQLLPYEQEHKPWLVIAPHQAMLQKAFGWGENTGALGVYIAETIIILSPQAWEWEQPSLREAVFARQGPLVHEYTHFLLDQSAQGNYPRWFSEGLAQYVEFQVLGYEWLEAGSSLANPLYSLQELTRQFDHLPNQALAYRQSLSMVSFLAARGDTGLNRLITLLGQGKHFDAAVAQVYGLRPEALMTAWQHWIAGDSRWLQIK